MSYDYESCFWDPRDDGVNVLLTHVQAGIYASGTVERFFKLRSELEKDYARRLGAINDRLAKELQQASEYGQMAGALQTLLETERARAHSHSKQSEVIYRQAYSNTKLFGGELQARYTTVSGKVEKLRQDKLNKRKGCEELASRLDKAGVKARDLRLNQNNIIGSKRVEQNERELAKWESNEQQIQLQLNVLKQEYRASQRYWLHEWSGVTSQLQEMETARIQFLQARLQEYIGCATETSVLEQTKLDLLNSKLATFTAMDDISKFSSEYGTGRLKEKHRQTSRSTQRPHTQKQPQQPISPPMDNSADYRSSRVSYNHLDRDPYMDNIRKLSSRLQRRSYSGKAADNNNSDTTLKALATTTSGNRGPETSQPDHYSDLMENSERRPISPPPEPVVEKHKPVSEASEHHHQSNSTTSESSSNPTDFTTHIKKRESMESMSTSVSSMASSIGEAQRFSKSWNSSTRKRKSMSHINQLLNSRDEVSHHHDNQPDARQSSTNTVINSQLGRPKSHLLNSTTSKDTRRKSMVLDSSKNPIEDALYEMERLQGSIQASSELGRVKDNGLIVTLPLVTRGGEPVIKYAKANYPLMDNGAEELANFEKNDYLLITEIISPDWYRGEVYDNERIAPEHRDGLIPFNFINILG